MTPNPRFEKIKILSNSTFVPLKNVHYSLIDHSKIQKTLNTIKKTTFQKSDKKIFYEICDFFNCKLHIRKNTKSCNLQGWTDLELRKITLFSSSLRNDKKTITHEIGHVLLKDVGLSKGANHQYFLSEIVKEEQRAETISYYLSKMIFKNDFFCKNEFKTYFKETDIIWLDKFYRSRGYEITNDLFILKNGKKKTK